MANQINNQSIMPSTDVIQLTLTLKMTTAQVVETSVTVNNNSPIQDYVHRWSNSTYSWKLALLASFLSTKLKKKTLSQARLVRLILIQTKSINPAAIFALGLYWLGWAKTGKIGQNWSLSPLVKIIPTIKQSHTAIRNNSDPVPSAILNRFQLFCKSLLTDGPVTPLDSSIIQTVLFVLVNDTNFLAVPTNTRHPSPFNVRDDC